MPNKSLKASRYAQLFWNEWKINPDNTGYNINLIYALEGPIEPQKLTVCLNKVISGNALYRSCFKEDPDGVLYQHFEDELENHIQYLDLSAAGDKKKILEEHINAFAAYKYNLSTPPLLRAALIKSDADRYILMISLHHIISDGTSLKTFIDAISAHYNNAPVNIEGDYFLDFEAYLDYENAVLKNPDEDISYWLKLLKGATANLDFSLFKKGKNPQGNKAGCYNFAVENSLLDKIDAFSNSRKISVFNIISAAWGILLFRYFKESDFILTYPVNVRPKNFSGIQGSLVNVVPVRIKINPEDSFDTVLEFLTKQRRNSGKLQYMPFVDIFSRLSSNHLFEIGIRPFNVTVADTAAFISVMPEFNGIVARRIPFPQIASSDLGLSYSYGNQSRIFQIEFSTKYFDHDFIRDMAEHFTNILSRSISAPSKHITGYSLLTKDEFEKQVFTWNKTGRDFDLSRPYIRRFEEAAIKYADKTAAKYKGSTISYKELNERSERLGAYLLSKGAGNNAVIGICAERSIELAVALLGIFKAGCAYLPLEAGRYPAERIEQMLSDAGVRHVIVCNSSEGIPLPGHLDIIDLKSNWKEIMETRDPIKLDLGAPEDTAYLIYTSGSTGIPKGVMISQKNLLNHNLSVIQDYALTCKDNVLQFGALGFDLSVEEIFPTWLSGGTLIFLEPGLMENPEELLAFISRERISFMDLPTAYWHELVGILKPNQLPESVRLVAIGGEKASIEHFNRWNQLTSGVKVLNTYGPTETTIIATISENFETIGKPIANTRTYILDKFLHPVPLGVPGDLYISGQCVSKGYLNRPEKNAESFLPDPFVTGDIMYKTGDLASYSRNGEIVFIGRADNQVKLRGFRIELGDIEAAMKQHPSIGNALVIVWENPELKIKSLAAYFVPASKSFNISDLKNFLKEKLPDYMIPQSFTQLSEIPLNPNGKIDRKALPAPAVSSESPGSQDANSEPESVLEVQVSLIFQKLLGVTVGRNASFFDSGGDSLSAIRLTIDIEKETGFKIPVEDLYSSPSIKAIASHIRNSSSSAKRWSSLVKLSSGNAKTPLYLIHTTPGDILGYVNLVKYITDRPVYGLQAYGINKGNTPHTSIPEMASYYKGLIYENNPAGPYCIAGWCYGGVVAFEMAQQIKADGKEIGYLGLIETWGQPAPSFITTLRRLSDFIIWGPSGWIGFLVSKLERLRGKNSDDDRFDFIAKRFSDGVSDGDRESLINLYHINMRAISDYHMKFYDGHINIIKISIENVKGMIPSRNNLWDDLARNISWFEVRQSEHGNILKEPHVKAVAGILQDSLGKAGI